MLPEGQAKRNMENEIGGRQNPSCGAPREERFCTRLPLTGKSVQTPYRSLPAMASTGVVASRSQPPPSHHVFGESIVWFVVGVGTGAG